MEDEGGAGGGRGNNNGTGSTRYVNARDLIEAHRAEAVRNNIDIPPIVIIIAITGIKARA